MAWLAVDKDGSEFWFGRKPKRSNILVWESMDVEWEELEKGSIEKLIGHPLTWEDEPVEI